MPLLPTSFFLPASGAIPFLIEDKYFRGGYRTVADNSERDLIPTSGRKPGMRVYVQSSGKIYTVATGQLSTWVEVPQGAVRGTYVFTAGSPVSPLGQSDFTVSTGKTAIILSVTVSDVDLEVQAHGLSARADVNPYKFISYAGHLTDDGTSKLENETLEFNRRYAIVVNQEGTPTANTYWRVINKGAGTVTPTVNITYLTVES